MPFRQKLLALIVSVFIIVIILELVRKRKLREEYSWLWILTGFSLMIFGLWHDLLIGLAKIMGIVAPTSALFFFGLIFLIIINIHFSVKISKMKTEIKILTQHIAITDFNKAKEREKIVEP